MDGVKRTGMNRLTDTEHAMAQVCAEFRRRVAQVLRQRGYSTGHASGVAYAVIDAGIHREMVRGIAEALGGAAGERAADIKEAAEGFIAQDVAFRARKADQRKPELREFDVKK